MRDISAIAASLTFQSALRFHRVSEITLFQAFKSRNESCYGAAGLTVTVKKKEAGLKARASECLCVCVCVCVFTV